MSTETLPEVWLRGPLTDVPALLQPAAHALLQAQEEIHKALQDFPGSKLWEQPAGAASVGFHLQHIPGVLDRLYSYAEGKPLSSQQLEYLKKEGNAEEGTTLTGLLTDFDKQLQQFIQQLKTIEPETLTNTRTVGRKQLPSTVMGLLFHAAEHTMRHTGQLLVTIRFIMN